MRATPLIAVLLLLGCAHEAPTAGAAGSASSAPPAFLALPGGEDGVGFDDLQWSPELRRLLVPAGRTGALDLVDPASGSVQQVTGFEARSARSSGHGDGCTSAVYGQVPGDGPGWIFAIDRSLKQLIVVDPGPRTIVARAPLAAGPDYVRWVQATREIWVTEPGAEQIEVFGLPTHGAPQPGLVTRIAVPGGPESLVIDATRHRAYSHLWKGSTVAIELASHAVVAHWENGCTGSRGIALDEAHGWLFVGCAEGRATVLDVAHEGRALGSTPTGEGVDIISYDAGRRHLYVPADSGTLTILGVGAGGQLASLATIGVCAGAQGVATDEDGHVFVGDPARGGLMVVKDELPPSTD